MQSKKSVADEIELLASERNLDNADLLALPLLSPSDFDFPPTETIAEGVIKTAPPPPSNSLKTTPVPTKRPHAIPMKQSDKKQKNFFLCSRDTAATTKERRSP